MAFDKVQYRKNREDGKRGQGDKPKPKITKNEASKAEISFGNDGETIVKNRAYRRRKIILPGSNQFTKIQMTKPERQKFRKLGRK